MSFSGSACSQIGKVDQDGQIEIWKEVHKVKDYFIYLSTFVLTKTFLSQIFSNHDC